MTPEIYTAIKTRLAAILGSDNKPLFKTIMLWNNQTEHELQKENDNYPINYPACFIEFSNINVTSLSQKGQVQQVDFDTTLHLARRVIKNEDIEILNDKLKVYKTMQVMEFTSNEPTVSRFLRISENPNYDNNLLMQFEQTYHATYKDFSAIPTPNTGNAPSLIIQPQIVNNIP
jgi:hypothetical protein